MFLQVLLWFLFEFILISWDNLNPTSKDPTFFFLFWMTAQYHLIINPYLHYFEIITIICPRLRGHIIVHLKISVIIPLNILETKKFIRIQILIHPFTSYTTLGK